jgi:hypothetical protein
MVSPVRNHHRRFQAETPLIALCRFAGPALFLVDAVFIAVAKPVSDWLAKHLVLRKLRFWIRSLRPYPSLALFSDCLGTG